MSAWQTIIARFINHIDILVFCLLLLVTDKYFFNIVNCKNPNRQLYHDTTLTSTLEYHDTPLTSTLEYHDTPLTSTLDYHDTPLTSTLEYHDTPLTSTLEYHDTPLTSTLEYHDTPLTSTLEYHDESEAIINQELGNINEWLKINKLSLNINKTKYLIFAMPNKRIQIPEIRLDGISIEKVSAFNSLGLTIDEQLNNRRTT